MARIAFCFDDLHLPLKSNTIKPYPINKEWYIFANILAMTKHSYFIYSIPILMHYG